MVSIGRTNSGSGTSASVYKPAGSVAFASLPVLGSTNEGKVYNVTDAFTTTSDFVEGSGKSYPAGTNVVCIDTGSSVYKWDVLSGFIDLSGYATSAQGAKADTAVQPGDLATVATTGSYSDLLNKPAIPTVDQTYGSTSANAQSGVAVASAISTMLATLYPVGSVYIGTQATCPLATLISGSTWTLVSKGRVLQGVDTGQTAGSTVAAGLPNITGSFGLGNITGVSYPYAVTNSTGSFAGGATGPVANVGTNSVQGYDTLVDFNASRSSAIYGSSSTVQPPAYLVNIWERTA